MHRNHAMRPMLILLIINLLTAAHGATTEIAIGVILDTEPIVGKISKICIQMALQDFYKKHDDYTTRIVPHFRDSKSDRVEAASAAIELIKDVKVMAIIGPQRSSQAGFVAEIGNRTNVPILSLATTPSVSHKENPYFIRVSHNSSSQAEPISAFITSFRWREVVLVYQHGDFGTGLIPSLSQALLDVGVQIKQPVVISPFASDDDISDHLYDLKTNQTRVFVVHLLPNLASRFFKKAKQAGMMEQGYAWIITDVVTNLLHTIDTDSMEGVVGVRPEIPMSDARKRFEDRLKSTEIINVYGLWSYDATFALAMAVENVGRATTFRQRKPKQPHITDLDVIGTSERGPTLLEEITKTRFKGLSGEFSLVGGQLQSDSGYQIVNIVGQEAKLVYSWTRSKNIRGKISNKEAIIWPGGSSQTPNGWEIPSSKLKVGYPSIGGFPEFIGNGTKDPNTNVTEPTGFCVDIFKAVMERLSLPQPPSLEYHPFAIKKNETSGSYSNLVGEIYRKNFDVVIGDVTIRADRSKHVDFTLPYTESGVSMVVPIKKDDRKNAWIFMRPLETELWLTTCVFFIYTGVVVWVLEHRVNKEFRGRPYKQVGMIFWFSFSTLVFAHKEKMISNLSRFVVIVWVFVVLVLQSSYIASLTSMLTVQQLQPAFTDIHDLMRQGDHVGYKEGSFVAEMLKGMGFREDKLIGYDSLEAYDKALSKREVSAIFDELPYLKLFLARHCNKYIMVGPTYKTAGFGFAFPKGSPLLPLVSRALLQVTEDKKLDNISDKWFGRKAHCRNEQDMGSNSRSGQLSLDSFGGLFLIAGVSSTCALIIYLFIFLYENKDMLLSDASIPEKFSAIAQSFHQEKQEESTEEDNDDVLVIEENITNPPPTPEHHHASDDDDNDDDDEAEATPTHHVVETRVQR